MTFIIIIIIAAAILAFFAFSGGSGASAPTLSDNRIVESVVNASVKDKDVQENMVKRSHHLIYFVKFDCDDGITREFEVSCDLYNAVEIGEQGELVYAGERLLGFGGHGAVEYASEPLPEDNFTFDDFDETIDVELDVGATPEISGLDPENQELLSLFRDRKPLPPKTEAVEDEAVSLREYSAASLLEKTTVYPFLKNEDAVRRMFIKTYGEAMTDLLGFDGDSRKGSSADSIFINRSEIRISITLQENPQPLAHRIYAEFGVNE